MSHNGVIIGVGMLILFVFISGCQDTNSKNGNQNNNTINEFLGDWEVIDSSPDYETWSFYPNRTAKNYLVQEFEGEILNTTSWFNYTIENTTLCFSRNTSPDSPDYLSICYSYLFSENATRLAFSSDNILIMNLIKMPSE